MLHTTEGRLPFLWETQYCAVWRQKPDESARESKAVVPSKWMGWVYADGYAGLLVVFPKLMLAHGTCAITSFPKYVPFVD